jgi:hypothetical protein
MFYFFNIFFLLFSNIYIYIYVCVHTIQNYNIYIIFKTKIHKRERDFCNLFTNIFRKIINFSLTFFLEI